MNWIKLWHWCTKKKLRLSNKGRYPEVDFIISARKTPYPRKKSARTKNPTMESTVQNPRKERCNQITDRTSSWDTDAGRKGRTRNQTDAREQEEFSDSLPSACSLVRSSISASLELVLCRSGEKECAIGEAAEIDRRSVPFNVGGISTFELQWDPESLNTDTANRSLRSSNGERKCGGKE